jgi:DNA-binding transcriptional MocR family regulator
VSEVWTPTIPDGEAPLYERLVSVLRGDIASGVLAAGARLPPQRDLAYRLGVGLGTVTRAYVEAEKAGLVSAHVGRGSFVNAPPVHRPFEREGPINLAQNIAPAGPAASRLAEALARLRKRPDLLEHLAYAPAAGHETQRRAGAAWISRTGGYLERRLDPADLLRRGPAGAGPGPGRGHRPATRCCARPRPIMASSWSPSTAAGG